MKPARCLAAVAGAVLAVGAAAPVASAHEPNVAPPGYQHLIDDSGRLSIDVPAAWTDIFSGTVNVDGSDVPTLAATVLGGGFPDDTATPGALYVAFPFTSDVAGLTGRFQPDGCQGPTSEAFQNGSLVGVVDHYTGCAPSGGERHVVAANPADSSFTGVLILQIGVPVDPSIAPTVLASLNKPAGAAPSAPVTVPVAPPVSTSGVPPVPITTVPVVPPVPVTTVPVVPPVTTASPLPPTPVTTTPALGGPDSNGVTVTNAGDPAAPVNLAVPFAVGQRGNSESFSTLAGTISVSGAESWSTGWEASRHDVGLDEVLTVNADGSSELRYTTSSIESSVSYSNPDITDSGALDPTVIEGIPLIIGYGPDRVSTSVAAAPGVTVSADQQTVIDSLSYAMPGAGFPSSPVGVGATWTAVERFYFEGMEIPGTVSYQLVAVNGDQYNVTSSATVDLSAVDAAAYPAGLTSASGTITVSSTITGSLSNPMQYRKVSTKRDVTTATWTDGTTWVIDTTEEHHFEETPA